MFPKWTAHCWRRELFCVRMAKPQKSSIRQRWTLESKTWELLIFGVNTVDGWNPARKPVSLVVYPIIYKVWYISGGARFQPSTVRYDNWIWQTWEGLCWFILSKPWYFQSQGYKHSLFNHVVDQMVELPTIRWLISCDLPGFGCCKGYKGNKDGARSCW